MGFHLEAELQKAFECLSNFEPEKAKEVVNTILVEDIGSSGEVKFCSKILYFWINNKRRILSNTELFSQGEQLISAWIDFLNQYGDEIKSNQQCVYAIQKGVFSYAIEVYKQILQGVNVNQKALVFNRIGLCYKELGDYETALSFLEEANSLVNNNAQTLADMADCYALCGNERDAKVLFREAFYIAPQEINFTLIESDIFQTIYQHVAKTKKKKEEIAEWIPVEGVILHILDCKRDLRAIEVGQLKQSIYSLETELKNNGTQQREILVPRLINKYMWLIDHYNTVGETRKIHETLLNIKLLDEDVYARYTV